MGICLKRVDEAIGVLPVVYPKTVASPSPTESSTRQAVKLGKADGKNSLKGKQIFLRQSDHESRLPRTVSWVPPPKTNDDGGSDENPPGQHLGPVPRRMV